MYRCIEALGHSALGIHSVHYSEFYFFDDCVTRGEHMAENAGHVARENENSRVELVLNQVLSQLKEQRDELNYLRSEVKDNSVSVKAEVVKLKEKGLAWKREGNKQQYNFNSDIEQDCFQAQWAVSNNKLDYARETLDGCVEKIKKRNKLIRIADTSEAGWDTVKLYESNPVASDSDDESRITKAENRALRKRKLQAAKTVKSKHVSATPSGPLPYSGAASFGVWGGPAYAPANVHSAGSSSTFRPPGGKRYSSGCCFSCGSFQHFRRDCPLAKLQSGESITKGTQ